MPWPHTWQNSTLMTWPHIRKYNTLMSWPYCRVHLCPVHLFENTVFGNAVHWWSNPIPENSMHWCLVPIFIIQYNDEQTPSVSSPFKNCLGRFQGRGPQCSQTPYRYPCTPQSTPPQYLRRKYCIDALPKSLSLRRKEPATLTPCPYRWRAHITLIIEDCTVHWCPDQIIDENTVHICPDFIRYDHAVHDEHQSKQQHIQWYGRLLLCLNDGLSKPG